METLAEVLARFPDNIEGKIKPEDFRALTRYAASPEQFIAIPITDESSDVALGIRQARLRKIPFPFTLLSASAECDLAPSGNPIVVDMNADGVTTMAVNKLVIDIGKLSTDQSAVQPELTTTEFPANTVLTFDVDENGTGVRGKGLVANIWIIKTGDA